MPCTGKTGLAASFAVQLCIHRPCAIINYHPRALAGRRGKDCPAPSLSYQTRRVHIKIPHGSLSPEEKEKKIKIRRGGYSTSLPLPLPWERSFSLPIPFMYALGRSHPGDNPAVGASGLKRYRLAVSSLTSNYPVILSFTRIVLERFPI